jgi:hypothetical protein
MATLTAWKFPTPYGAEQEAKLREAFGAEE